MLDLGGGVPSGANNHFPRRDILPICSSIKPLSRRCLSKDILVNKSRALDCVGADLLCSSSISLMEVCFFRQYLPSGKPGNSNSTQKIAAVIQMNRTKTNRATRENLCIMHSATAHSKLTLIPIVLVSQACPPSSRPQTSFAGCPAPTTGCRNISWRTSINLEMSNVPLHILHASLVNREKKMIDHDDVSFDGYETQDENLGMSFA